MINKLDKSIRKEKTILNTNSYEQEFMALVGPLGAELDAIREQLCTYDIRDLREVNGLKLEMKHKAVLWALDSRGANIYPNQKTIAEDCGMSVTTVQRVIKQLEEVDLIAVHKRKGTSNRYKIHRSLIRKLAQQNRDVIAHQKYWQEREMEAKTKDWDIK